ncbi:MAG: proton-conducting transporter membrane subunit [Firmicutes bacterium]|jgi:multicomponent Na+:H+ antiporter subunit D|nr:proton-conducting transporter membrane subunit [Bacillota bacterium]
MTDLVLALLSGAVGGILIGLMPRAGNRLRNIVALVFSAAGTIFSWRVAGAVFAGHTIRISGEIAGLAWSLQPDPLGAIFGLIVSTLWLFAGVYSFGYMAGEHKQRTYYTYFLLAFSVTLGVAFSGNLLALYLFYELLTFVTYPLVIHERSSEAMKAGAKYIVYSLSGAGAILIAIIVVYSWTGNLDFAGGPLLAAGGLRPGLGWVLALFVAGFGVKAAIMPLHRWLPAAMCAPTPVSALLHAVAVVYSGVYGILRVVYSVFGHELMGQLHLSDILPWVASFTILVGVIIATQQDVLKRRLAYHTVSQLSYILLGAFTLHPWGLAGAICHMISYSTLKVTLFFAAGVIAKRTGKVRVSEMSGVGWQLPRTMAAFGVASLGMIGMLPLNTFWSKYYLMRGSVAKGKWQLALVLITSGLINAFCFIPTVVAAFAGERGQLSLEKGSETSLMLAPMLLLAGIALLIGLWPGLVWPGVEAVVDWFF